MKRCSLRKIRYNLRYVCFHHTAAQQTIGLPVDVQVTMSCDVPPQEGDEDDADEAGDKQLTSHPDADTTIIFMTGEGCFVFFFIQ